MNTPDFIETDLGVYNLALITKENIYYVNEDECDENASVMMFDHNKGLVSDNYFAYGAFMDDMEAIIGGRKPYYFLKDSYLENAKKFFAENN